MRQDESREWTKWPLRRVIGRLDGQEYLECGHILSEKEDIYGPTFPLRRRCWTCWEGLESEVD